MADANRKRSNAEYDARRRADSATRALYGTQRWRRKAAHQMLIEPLCAMCLARGDTRAASVADHVVPHRGDVDAFWNGELSSLCKQDHDTVKQREERRGYSDSVDLDGWPVDPKHPANAHHGAQGDPQGPVPEGGVPSLGPFDPRPAATLSAELVFLKSDRPVGG